jgi:hypothetical protein
MSEEQKVFNSETQVAIREQTGGIMDYAQTVQNVLAQRRLIVEVMGQLMIKDQHYLTLPGTDKPMLCLAGAETLATVFRFAPSFEFVEKELANGHLEVRAICTLTHIPTGAVLAELSGSCTTREAKYRYRDGDPEPTDRPVPPEYWQLKRANKLNEALELIGGKKFKPVKTDDGWFIGEKNGGKVENENPEDLHNTALKMAQKRAFVGAVRLAAGASDIFAVAETPDAALAHKDRMANRGKNASKDVIPTEDLEAKLSEITTVKDLTQFFNAQPKPTWKNPANMQLFSDRMAEIKAAAKTLIACPYDDAQRDPDSEDCTVKCSQKCAAWHEAQPAA